MHVASLLHRRRSAFGFLTLLAACCVLSAPAALAQVTKIFVASYGNDANDGSRLSPKRNFQPAHDAVIAGGQIVVLDTAGYGALTITKSLAITVPPGVNGFVTTTGDNNGITINSNTAVVSLRGLIVEGGGGNISAGIYATRVKTLRIDDCIVRNFSRGIYVFSLTNPTRVVIQGGSVRDVGYGIAIQPANTNIAVDAIVTDCAVDKASVAALYAQANSSGSTGKLTAKRCALTHSGYAISTFGSGATIYADNCTASGNAAGVYAGTGTGSTFSRSNNTFTNNPSGDGIFTGTFAAQ